MKHGGRVDWFGVLAHRVLDRNIVRKYFVHILLIISLRISYWLLMLLLPDVDVRLQ